MRTLPKAPVRRDFDLTVHDSPLVFRGISGAEPEGRWTDGPFAELVVPAPHLPGPEPVLLVSLEMRPFLHGEILPEQLVEVSVNGQEAATWSLRQALFRRHVLAVQRQSLGMANDISIGLELPRCAQPAAFRLNEDARRLGVMIRRVVVEGAASLPAPDALFWQYGRPVGGEAAKSFDRRIEAGFWSRFVTGPNILDIGFRGYEGAVLPILEGAIGIDLDYPGYDGRRLPFEDGSQDAVFSSHCLEHIGSHINAIQDWFRVTRVGGHIITVVPNAAIYERRRRPPSCWNDDHQRFYSPASLLAEFEAALAPNTYRVRLLEENDEGYRYENPADTHPTGCYEIVLVIEKIAPPAWPIEA
jgi:SAM-dependent methyltransferase